MWRHIERAGNPEWGNPSRVFLLFFHLSFFSIFLPFCFFIFSFFYLYAPLKKRRKKKPKWKGRGPLCYVLHHTHKKTKRSPCRVKRSRGEHTQREREKNVKKTRTRSRFLYNTRALFDNTHAREFIFFLLPVVCLLTEWLYRTQNRGRSLLLFITPIFFFLFRVSPSTTSTRHIITQGRRRSGSTDNWRVRQCVNE